MFLRWQRDSHRPLQKKSSARPRGFPGRQPGPARQTPHGRRRAAPGEPSSPLASLPGRPRRGAERSIPAWRPARTQVRGPRVSFAPGPPQGARARRGRREAAGPGRRANPAACGSARERTHGAGSRARGAGGGRWAGQAASERAKSGRAGGRARGPAGGGRWEDGSNLQILRLPA